MLSIAFVKLQRYVFPRLRSVCHAYIDCVAFVSVYTLYRFGGKAASSELLYMCKPLFCTFLHAGMTCIIIIYILIITNFRAHGHREYPLFADTLHTCSIHIRNVKYKGQQLFCLYSRLSSCFLSKLTARYSDTIRVVGWQVTS